MNNHYTGYELELNQSRQAAIRSEFENQARAKSLNEESTIEGSSPAHKQSEGNRLVKAGVGLISLLGAVMLLVFLLGVSSNQAAAVLFKNAPADGSTKASVSNSVGSAPVASVAAESPFPVGGYTVKVVAKDIPPLLRFEEPSVNKYRGDWFVSLDVSGNFTASLNDQVMLQGQFAVNFDQITFTSSGETPLCGNDPEEISGTYTRYPVEEGIGLTPISDKCYPRSLVLSSHSLKLVNPVYNPVPVMGQ